MNFTKVARTLMYANPIAARNISHAIKENSFLVHANKNPTMLDIQRRFLSTHQLTKNMRYVTNHDDLKIKVDPKTMKLENPNGNPLVIMLCWLGSTKRNIDKYTALYLEQGYDLLTVRISIKQALWPEPDVKNLARDLLNFLEQNVDTFNPAFLSCFSIATYMWAELLILVEQDLERYGPVINKLKVQIWDSLIDANEFQYGVAKSLFPGNRIMTQLVYQYLGYHMKKYHDTSTIHYINANNQLPTNRLTAPMLHFCSKADIVGSFKTNIDVTESWRKMGTQVTQNIFEDSPHVQHLHYYPKEYLSELYLFLNKHQLLFKPDLLMKRIEEVDKVVTHKSKVALN